MHKTILFIVIYSCIVSTSSICQTYDFFVSSLGSDSNAGTSKMFPRKTLSGSSQLFNNFGLQNGFVNIGLKSTEIFCDKLSPTSPVTFGSYDIQHENAGFAVLNGANEVNEGWKRVTATANCYIHAINFKGFAGAGINAIGAYSYIYVVEINRALEKTQPFSARKPLKFVTNLNELETTPGSFYENPVPLGVGNGTTDVYIHSTDGESPNNHQKYRYELTTLDKAVDAYRIDNCKFENLWVTGYGAGYGPLPGGSNSLYNKVVFGPGAAIHHLVTKNASISNCLFLPGARNTGDGALVFYDLEGYGRRNRIVSSIFLDIKSPIYSHISSGANFSAIEVDKVVAFADTEENGNFVSASNTDSAMISRVYADRFSTVCYNVKTKYMSICDSYFNDVNYGVRIPTETREVIVRNSLIRCLADRSAIGIVMARYADLTLVNSLVQLTNTGNFSSSFVGSSGGSENSLLAKANVFIADIADPRRPASVTSKMASAMGDHVDVLDSNVYILLNGSKIQWTITNPSAGVTSNPNSFDDWKRLSGQDAHSLFFDLRNDPRGLKAVFIDPDKGNYELANTVIGNKIRALKAGMLTPLNCFLKKPTYEEAADMILNGKVMAVNSCKSPCQKAKAKIDFNITNENGNLTVCAENEIILKGTGSFIENNVFYHQSAGRQRYLWSFSDETDTSGVNLNSITHRFANDGQQKVRLQMVDENGCSYDTSYSIIVKPRPVKPFLGGDTALCTGQILPLAVQNEQVADSYSWNNGAANTAAVSVTTEGKYWVKSQNAFGCIAGDTILVTNKTPVSVNLGNDTVYCASKTFTLKASTTGNVQSFLWNTGQTGDRINLTRAGTYSVMAKDTGVCIARDTITISDNPINTFRLPGDTMICQGTSYMLTLTTTANTTVTWSDGVSNASRIVQSGSYGIAATNNGCTITDSMNVGMQALPVVYLGPDTTMCKGFTLPLSVHYPAASYLWSTGDTDSAIDVQNAGRYWVQATVNKCSYRDSLILKLKSCDCNFQIPNAFSPNGDGINDYLVPKMDCYPYDYSFSIFNRHGQLIYSSTNYMAFWDGTFNGQPVPVGTYYYVLKFSNEKLNVATPFNGSITLLR